MYNQRKQRTKSGVYILELTDGCLYVGYSDDIESRIEEHFAGEGSAWTKAHSPVKVLHTLYGKTKIDESSETLKLMAKYGWKKVRGGPWCTVELQNPPLDQIAHITDSCLRCGRNNHWVEDCFARAHLDGTILPPKESRKVTQTHTTGLSNPQNAACFRCGQAGHIAVHCSLTGYKPAPPTTASPVTITCFRCGRPGHMANTCNVDDESESDDEDDVCFNCGKRGHWATECYKSNKYRKLY